MSDLQIPKFELLVLELFCKRNNSIELSPKNVDKELQFGIEKVIGLFLDLELKGLVKWISLDLVKLNLERSTKEIYDEVYNSLAQITQHGELIIERYKSEQLATQKSET